MLNERSQTQKATYHMIPFLWNVQNRQIHRDRKQINDCQRKGGKENEESLFNGFWVLLWNNGNISEPDRFLQHCECTIVYATELYTLKWLILLIICEFHFNKKYKIQKYKIQNIKNINKQTNKTTNTKLSLGYLFGNMLI